MSDSQSSIPVGFCQCGCGQRTPLATRNRRDLGHRKGEPLRFVNGHNPVKRTPFYRVDPASGCWLWERGSRPGGYGVYWHPERKQNVGAHRYMFELHKGPIPSGHHVHHTCGVRACCNPAHLEALPPKSHVRRGGPTKMTAELAAQVRAAYAAGDRTQDEIAEQFGIGQMTVSDIVTGVTWSDSARLRTKRSVEQTEAA